VFGDLNIAGGPGHPPILADIRRAEGWSGRMDAYVVGVAMTPFTSRPQGLIAMAEQVAADALADAGVSADEVGLVFVGNAAAGLIQGQEMVRGQVLLSRTPLAGKPIVNVENACASSSTAFHLAAGAVAGGQVDVALALGVEEMYHPDKLRTFGALAAATDTLRRPDMFELVDTLALRGGRDPGTVTSSPLMQHYADKAAQFLRRVGGEPADLARVVVKSRANGARNDRAQLREPVTVEQVLADRPISPPLTRSMCAPISNGAAAVVVASPARRARGVRGGVRVAASTLVSHDLAAGVAPATRAAQRAYELAGVAPEDIDLAELHDAAAGAELILMEAVGLCGEGKSIGLLRDGKTALGGPIPVNPSGGLLSRGHPLGATGCAQLVELTEQLLGRGGRRQVRDARMALAQNSGGVLGDDEAVATVTILERVG
jgi:acetyl-CoA acetyltransferase